MLLHASFGHKGAGADAAGVGALDRTCAHLSNDALKMLFGHDRASNVLDNGLDKSRVVAQFGDIAQRRHAILAHHQSSALAYAGDLGQLLDTVDVGGMDGGVIFLARPAARGSHTTRGGGGASGRTRTSLIHSLGSLESTKSLLSNPNFLLGLAERLHQSVEFHFCLPTQFRPERNRPTPANVGMWNVPVLTLESRPFHFFTFFYFLVRDGSSFFFVGESLDI